jgi:hypothetical protein
MTVSSIRSRAGLLGLAAVVAAVVGAVSVLSAGGATRPAQAAAHERPSIAKVVAFHEAMDKLWTDHVTWTRLVIVGFDANAPDLKPDLARLLRNQADIGDAITPFYGHAAGERLTGLLRTHIKEAVPMLAAAKAGDKAKLRKALRAWYANAHRIAVFLTRLNPANWPLSETTAMMRTHLKLTTNEAVAHLKRAWKHDIAAYDRVRGEILMMADTLAAGIIKQFPGRFA